MTEHKFTDGEVIKALEVCAENTVGGEGFFTYRGIPLRFLCSDTLDLINRQKAEISALTSAVDNSTQEFLKLHDEYQEQKAEIERLKALHDLAPCKIGDKVYDVIVDGGKLYIEELTVTEVATKRIFCSAHVPPKDDIDIVIPLEEIGVNVFFSREAAEAAGKEMEGGAE